MGWIEHTVQMFLYDSHIEHVNGSSIQVFCVGRLKVMLHPIDPTVDWVFKILFGSESNKDILMDFLNSILKPVHKICAITLMNPYN